MMEPLVPGAASRGSSEALISDGGVLQLIHVGQQLTAASCGTVIMIIMCLNPLTSFRQLKTVTQRLTKVKDLMCIKGREATENV